MPAAWMSVPKAAIYKDHSVVFGQRNIRRAGKMLGMQRIAETFRVQIFTYNYFRRSVLSPYLRHTIMPLFGCHCIRHRFNS